MIDDPRIFSYEHDLAPEVPYDDEVLAVLFKTFEMVTYKTLFADVFSVRDE